MVQRITVGFVGADYMTLQAAINGLTPAVPFTEPIVLETHGSAATEAIVVPATLLPTAANPLVIYAFRGPTVASPFPSQLQVGGSFATIPPPQPGLQRPVMSSIELRANNTHVDGLQINGLVDVIADNGCIVRSCIVDGGRVRVERISGAQISVTVSLFSNEIRKTSVQSSIFIHGVSGVKAYHNTVLHRRSDMADAGLTGYAVEIVASVVDVRNSLFAAQGVNTLGIRFEGPPDGSIFRNNFYAIYDGAQRFNYAATGGTGTVTDSIPAWASFMTAETGSLEGDPEFRDRLSASAPNLDISNTSPAVAKAPFIPEVLQDVRGERRPVDLVTIGAHEHAEIVVDSGKKRFLELLGGISNDPVNCVVLGNSTGPSIFMEIEAKPPSEASNLLFTPQLIPPANIVVPGTAGQEGLIVYNPFIQAALPSYEELIDSVQDYADEVALSSSDGTVFLVKRVREFPADATGFMQKSIVLPLEITA